MLHEPSEGGRAMGHGFVAPFALNFLPKTQWRKFKLMHAGAWGVGQNGQLRRFARTQRRGGRCEQRNQFVQIIGKGDLRYQAAQKRRLRQ